jgi:Rps23 Pro-64 3,4-dihydroxylase Tpa1-like proline 4-hydroxylase
MIDNWNVKIINENPLFPILIIDNYYSKQEETYVWNELNFLISEEKSKIYRSEKGKDVARNEKGEPKGLSYRFYLDGIYNDNYRHISPILRLLKKVQNPDFHLLVRNLNPYGRLFHNTNNDKSLVTYYENDDKYDSHVDTFMFTQCIYFVKEPKVFDGGDLVFKDIDTKINLKQNRCVFFPSCFEHQSTPIKFKNKTNEFGLGKFTISHFYYYA